jgi:flavin reductase (DIM6/NTAB) family NADH-FMN oxidoreductase RutF
MEMTSQVMGASDRLASVSSFRAAMRRVASTVTIVTTAGAGSRHGMTATAVTSVSADPPSLLVCINQGAGIHACMQSADYFCVNVLRASQVDVAAAFSGALDREARFGVGTWLLDLHAIPYLDDAQANLFCRKLAQIPHASHTIFLGEVCDVRALDRVEPLLYNDGSYATAMPRAA